MALKELKFNGSNGHSRILVGGKDITVPLMWLDDLKLLSIPKSEMLKGETQEKFYRWIVELNKPALAMYYARSDDYNNRYLGVQYYCIAEPDHLEPRIPVGAPKMLPLVTGNIDQLINSLQRTKDATGHIQTLDQSGRFAVVQYYKMR
ncbi:MAG: hypothetical protein Q8R47_00495 [Nanoarchaeota archaeon]|nr:hypothetical protein [Nanoarchaeota archaeon]